MSWRDRPASLSRGSKQGESPQMKGTAGTHMKCFWFFRSVLFFSLRTGTLVASHNDAS